MCQLVATLCATLSLALVALGGFDLLTGFALNPRAFVDPTAIVGPISDMALMCSHDV
jgi:hypothetical protein